MTTFLLNIMLALAWAALLGEFTTTNFVAGFALGFFALWVMQYIISGTNYFIKARQIITLVGVFVWALIQSNLRVAVSVLSPLDKMQPAIVALPLDITSDAEITLLANMITLTPGTLSLDVSNDKRTLYVHGMHVYDLEAFKREIKDGFERRVREAFE
jgi:multicomponent Na+:H+ antiporter subunit E